MANIPFDLVVVVCLDHTSKQFEATIMVYDGDTKLTTKRIAAPNLSTIFAMSSVIWTRLAHQITGENVFEGLGLVSGDFVNLELPFLDVTDS